MAKTQYPRLHIAMITVALAAFVGAVALLSFPVRSAVTDYEVDARSQTAARAAAALGSATSIMMEREWTSLREVASQINDMQYDQMRSFADGVVGASGAVSRVAIANRRGVVVAASNGLREGVEVQNRGWFMEGLNGGRAGQVYTLSSVDSTDVSNRYMSLSYPIVSQTGATVGVIMYQIRISWLQANMRRMADEMGVSFVVAAGDGHSLFSSSTYEGEEVPQSVLALAQTGRDLTRAVQLENGDERVVSIRPRLLTGDMPAFDMQLFVATDPTSGSVSVADFMSTMIWALAGYFLIVTLLASFYAMHFLRPLESLIRTADAIASGKSVYPEEHTSSRESVLLSGALVRIQSRLDMSRY